MTSESVRELDVVVVGFGPAGIAFTCSVADHAETVGCNPLGSMLCIEKSNATAWHGDFLLPDTDINHHIFRDLVTPRNPRSRFSFAMYLKECGRLYRFGLLGRPPSRNEWSEYVAWVASQLSLYVSYGEAVLALTPISDRGALKRVKVVTSKRAYLTKTVVLSSGSYPNIPDVFVPHVGPRVFHTSEYLPRLAALSGVLPRRWLVVGSGQSAGEAVSDLLKRNPNLSVASVHRSSGFNIGQLGQFPNLAFLPEQVDYFHKLPAAKRLDFLTHIRAINYAGIDSDQSQALYSQIYEDGIKGLERLHMFPFSAVSAISKVNEAFRVTVRDVFSQEEHTIEVDTIVLGTGFEKPKIPPILAELLPWIVLGEDGGILVERNYRILLRGGDEVAVYANGLSERTHGISDTQSFSLLATRSECIFNCLTDRHRQAEVRQALVDLELV